MHVCTLYLLSVYACALATRPSSPMRTSGVLSLMEVSCVPSLLLRVSVCCNVCGLYVGRVERSGVYTSRPVSL